MGTVLLLALIIIEIFFMGWELITKRNHSIEKSVVRLAETSIFAILCICGVLEWSFRYTLIAVVLTIQSIISIVTLIKKVQKDYKLSSSILRVIRNALIYTSALFIAILCPQNKMPATTGEYDFSVAKYTWTDTSRIETFTDTGENRSVTIDFYYPDDMTQKYPLTVFSHGAFGINMSNYSTYVDLASNGYVVAVITHPYHALYNVDANNKITMGDTNTLNEFLYMQNNDDSNEFEFIHNALKLRVDDEGFVLDTIIEKAANPDEDKLFSIINTDKIGVFGHSLGGASSACLGRERNDIDAVIVLDGTMIGDVLSESNAKQELNSDPYPVPILNIYAEDHYNNAIEYVGDDYVNFYESRNAVDAQEIVIRNSGHMNFTDLPLFCPYLANQLGTGAIDSRECIEKINNLTVEYFDYYLKDGEKPNFQKEY